MKSVIHLLSGSSSTSCKHDSSSSWRTAAVAAVSCDTLLQKREHACFILSQLKQQWTSRVTCPYHFASNHHASLSPTAQHRNYHMPILTYHELLPVSVSGSTSFWLSVCISMLRGHVIDSDTCSDVTCNANKICLHKQKQEQRLSKPKTMSATLPAY